MKKKSLKRCLKKRMILLLGFLMMTGVAVAQQLQVQGKVTDATGEGLIGASVLVKGTTSGVITDIDGNYVLLNVNPDAILIFSYVGYQTQELNVSGRNKIDVVLHDDQQVLEEVVVVGYKICNFITYWFTVTYNVYQRAVLNLVSFWYHYITFVIISLNFISYIFLLYF